MSFSLSYLCTIIIFFFWSFLHPVNIVSIMLEANHPFLFFLLQQSLSYFILSYLYTIILSFLISCPVCVYCLFVLIMLEGNQLCPCLLTNAIFILFSLSYLCKTIYLFLFWIPFVLIACFDYLRSQSFMFFVFLHNLYLTFFILF